MERTSEPLDRNPYRRVDSMIPGADELGIMICEFETSEGARWAAELALSAYRGPAIGLRVVEPLEHTMLAVFEEWNDRPYTEAVKARGVTFVPTLEAGDGAKVLPRYRLDGSLTAEMLIFTAPNDLHSNAGVDDLWVGSMTGGIIINKVKI